MSKRSIFLYSTILLVSASFLSLHAIKSFRGVGINGFVPIEDLDKSARILENTLLHNIPETALISPVKVSSGQSSSRWDKVNIGTFDSRSNFYYDRSAIGVDANFASVSDRKRYTPYIEQQLRKHVPDRYYVSDNCYYKDSDDGNIFFYAEDEKAIFSHVKIPTRLPLPKIPPPANSGYNIQIQSQINALPSPLPMVHFKNGESRPLSPEEYDFLADRSLPLHERGAGYFQKCYENREISFESYELYQFSGFRDFVEGHPDFEDFILKTKERMLSDHQFEESLKWVSGFEGSIFNDIRNLFTAKKHYLFHEYINKHFEKFYTKRYNAELAEYQQQQEKRNQEIRRRVADYVSDLVAKNDPDIIDKIDQQIENLEKHLSSSPLSRELYESTLQVVNDSYQARYENSTEAYSRSLARINALLQSFDSNEMETKEHAIDSDLILLSGVEVNSLKESIGLPIQHHLHGEYVDISHDVAVLNGISTLEPSSQVHNDGMSGLINYYSELAHCSSEDKNFERSLAFNDICWNLLNAARYSTIINMDALHAHSSTVSHDSLPTKIVSALKSIGHGSIEGVQQFSEKCIVAGRMYYDQPSLFIKEYADSITSVYHGVYKVGNLACRGTKFLFDPWDVKKEKFNRRIENLASKYEDFRIFLKENSGCFSDVGLDDCSRESISFLLNLGLGVLTGRARHAVTGQMLSSLSRVARALRNTRTIKRALMSTSKKVKATIDCSADLMKRSHEILQSYGKNLSNLANKAKRRSFKESRRFFNLIEKHNYTKKAKEGFKAFSNHPIAKEIWSKKSCLHVYLGEYHGSKLTGGLHTMDGFLKFVQERGLNPGMFIFERMRNGAYRVQFPEHFQIGSTAYKKAGKVINEIKKSGIKTIWPSHYTAERLLKESQRAFNKAKKAGKTVMEGLTSDGVPYRIRLDEQGKIVTFFPYL